MPTLILSPMQSEDSLALGAAARDAGWQVERLESWRPPGALAGRADLALYGEALFVRALADPLGCALLEALPGWLLSLPAWALGRRVRLMKLGDAALVDGPAFIKPAGDKAFASKVYETGDAFLATVTELSRSISILVSEPVRWALEYRCFVRARRVETLALYEEDGRLTKQAGRWPRSAPSDGDALAFAQRVVDDPAIDAPPAFVMDVGLIADRGWAVLEANPAWGSGIYGCDPARVLGVVARACVSAAALTAADRAWVPAWESWYEDGG